MRDIEAQEIISRWAKRSPRNQDALRIFMESVVVLNRRRQRPCCEFGWANAIAKAKAKNLASAQTKNA